MGSGSNGKPTKMYCDCHGSQTVALFLPGEGIEVQAKHHGTWHVGSLSAAEVLRRLAGTVDGSAVLDFVREQV